MASVRWLYVPAAPWMLVRLLAMASGLAQPIGCGQVSCEEGRTRRFGQEGVFQTRSMMVPQHGVFQSRPAVACCMENQCMKDMNTCLAAAEHTDTIHQVHGKNTHRLLSRHTTLTGLLPSARIWPPCCSRLAACCLGHIARRLPVAAAPRAAPW
jgi:hypothetical protein